MFQVLSGVDEGVYQAVLILDGSRLEPVFSELVRVSRVLVRLSFK